MANRTKYTLTTEDGKTVHTYDPYQAADLYEANRVRGVQVNLTSRIEEDDED